MTVFLEYIRKKLGWCPNVDVIRPIQRASAEADYESAWKGRGPGATPAPDLPVVHQREFLPIILVLSAVAMFYDAQSIRAGDKFEKETLLGDIVTWQPLTWGAATLVGGIIIMAIYLFHRREIYRANFGGEASA